jgi:hypothetical protein
MQCAAHDKEYTHPTGQVSMPRIDLHVTGHHRLSHSSNATSKVFMLAATDVLESLVQLQVPTLVTNFPPQIPGIAL